MDDAETVSPPLDPVAFSDLGFVVNALDRRAEWRSDAKHIVEEEERPDCVFVLLNGDKAIVDADRDPPGLLFDGRRAASLDAAREERIYLGRYEDRPVFAARSSFDAEDENLPLIDLRTLAMDAGVPPAELNIVATARALYAWHDTHGFCARCGKPTVMADAGWRRHCPDCEASHFPRTDPVVIMLINHGDRTLLGRSARFGPGMYSCLAGFVEPGETIEDAVRREVMEEAGIVVGKVDCAISQPWPFPMSLMIGCVGVAETTEIRLNDNELEDARWFTMDEIAEMARGTHPDYKMPPKLAIAHHLIRMLDL